MLSSIGRRTRLRHTVRIVGGALMLAICSACAVSDGKDHLLGEHSLTSVQVASRSTDDHATQHAQLPICTRTRSASAEAVHRDRDSRQLRQLLRQPLQQRQRAPLHEWSAGQDLQRCAEVAPRSFFTTHCLRGWCFAHSSRDNPSSDTEDCRTECLADSVGCAVGSAKQTLTSFG